MAIFISRLPPSLSGSLNYIKSRGILKKIIFIKVQLKFYFANI